MLDNPKFKTGEHVYIKESAALGFLETVRINGVYKGPHGWAYTISTGSKEPAASRYYGDRVSLVNNSILFFSENELIEVCEALNLAESSLQHSLNTIQAKKAFLCPSTES